MEMEKEESLGRREKERSNEEVREKNNKDYLHSYNTYVYLHGYYSRVYIYKLIHPLMWVVFGEKCVNLTTFCIIHRLVRLLYCILTEISNFQTFDMELIKVNSI